MQGFVDAAEAGAGIGGDIFEAQRLDDVHHEVRTRAIGGVHIDARRRRGGFGGGLFSARQRIGSGRAMNFRRFLCFGGFRFHHQRGSAGSCSRGGAFQEAAAVN